MHSQNDMAGSKIIILHVNIVDVACRLKFFLFCIHVNMDPEIFDEIDKNEKKGKRHYVGTKNGYTEDDIAKLVSWAQNECTYLVYGREVGDLCGTPHLQIYMEMKFQRTFKAVNKKLFPMWLGYRRGKPKAAAGYCMKGTDIVANGGYERFYANPSATWVGEQFGKISEQGHRTDIDDVVEAIVGEKRTLSEVQREYPRQYVKYHRGLEKLIEGQLSARRLQEMPEVIVLYGTTGTGKTERAYDQFWPDIEHYMWKPSNEKWWDGYAGQDKIIMDEFRGQGMTWGDLLGLLDKYECRVPIKGGFTQIQATKFVITSPKNPREWYKTDNQDRFDQLLRRLTSVYHCTGLGMIEVQFDV